MIIGTFEIAISLIGLMIVVLVGQANVNTALLLLWLVIYGAMGAGLLAIQEWARYANVVLHVIAVPYTIYTSVFLDGPPAWPPLLIAFGIIYALTRPNIRYKFQTVVPKRKKH
jgi:uncharacterized membrane protein (DUF2068 family)